MAKRTRARRRSTSLVRHSYPLSRRRGGGRRRASSGGALSGRGPVALLTALALGWAQGAGHLAQIPTVAQLGGEGTVALGAWAWRKFLHGPAWLDGVAIGAGCVALNHIGRTGLSALGGHAVGGGYPDFAGAVGAEDPFAVSGEDD